MKNNYTVNGDTVFVEAKRGQTGEIAIFQCDLVDIDNLNKCLSWGIKGLSIIGYQKIKGKWFEITLHKHLMGSKFVDFLNGDRLDLRRCNMIPLKKEKKVFKNRGQVKGNRIDLHGNTATIWTRRLDGKGGAFLIDAENIERVKKYTWFMINPGYPATWTLEGVKNRKLLLLHRFLTGAEPSQQVDHINRIKTDARRQNLRICTRSQNAHNAGLFYNNTSGVKGVHHSSDNSWRASMRLNGSRMYRGFSTFLQAVDQRKEWESTFNPSGLINAAL